MIENDLPIKRAVEILKRGGIVIFPTDTAFGIGCRIDDEAAVQKVFSIRNRPVTKATPVLIDTVKMAKEYSVGVSQEILDTLIEPYWPGALTIVLGANLDRVPSLVRGGGVTVGLRIPHHQTPRALIRGVGAPLLGPSANFSGGETPFKLADIDPKLLTLVDYVVPGVCTNTKSSTVIDCSEKPWKILRDGAINLHEIKQIR